MGWFSRKPKLVNDEKTPTSAIIQQMNEPRPLPMGQKEFDEWATRIISGALIPTDDKESLRAILASMILQLGGQESHKPDAYFIHSLRKAAANEVAHANFQALKKKKEAEAADKKEADAKEAEIAKHKAQHQEEIAKLQNRVTQPSRT